MGLYGVWKTYCINSKQRRARSTLDANAAALQWALLLPYGCCRSTAADDETVRLYCCCCSSGASLIMSSMRSTVMAASVANWIILTLESAGSMMPAARLFWILPA